MAIKTYLKTSITKLTQNFKVSEFACKGRGCCSTVMIDSELADDLQKIRDHFGKPVTITSGYRCATHNKAVGGASNSYHTKGQAADIVVTGVTPSEVAKYAESIGMLGIGRYSNFTHVDTRTTKYYWIDGKGSVSTFGGKVETPKETTGSSYTKTQFIKDVQKALGVPVTGIADTKTLNATITVSAYRNRKHAVVEPIQKYLYTLGYKEIGTADGKAGSMFATAVKKFQEKNGCVKDGVITAKRETWKNLLGLS